jgi:hypothetical protein
MRKSAPRRRERFDGRHRFEHWYRDNTVYFITARVRGGEMAFASDRAKAVFWDRFDFYSRRFGFTPWVTTLMVNHYHTLGYLRVGENLGQMMRRLHGSVAKLVNDALDVRIVPFWRDKADKSYFDGCIRDELQCRRAYRYVLTQCVRHGICPDWRNYSGTRVEVELERGLRRALELKAFLPEVPYKRYERRGAGGTSKSSRERKRTRGRGRGTAN